MYTRGKNSFPTFPIILVIVTLVMANCFIFQIFIVSFVQFAFWYPYCTWSTVSAFQRVTITIWKDWTMDSLSWQVILELVVLLKILLYFLDTQYGISGYKWVNCKRVRKSCLYVIIFRRPFQQLIPFNAGMKENLFAFLWDFKFHIFQVHLLYSC